MTSLKFDRLIRDAVKDAARLEPWKKVVLMQEKNQTAALSGKRLEWSWSCIWTPWKRIGKGKTKIRQCRQCGAVQRTQAKE